MPMSPSMDPDERRISGRIFPRDAFRCVRGLLLALMTLIGCSSSRVVQERPCPDYDAINTRLADKRASVYLADYTRALALDVQMTADSTRWLRPDSTEVVVSSREVVRVAVTRPRWPRMVVPAVPLAALLMRSTPWSVAAAFGLMVAGNVASTRILNPTPVFSRRTCLENQVYRPEE